MAINPPVDATKTPEWAALQKHYDELQSEGISLKQWFADDAERVEKLSFDAGDLHFDLSKNLIKPETLQLFADLAKAVKLDERTKAMYTGVHINNTEDRAVLHTALRRPVEDEGKYIVDGQDTVKDVREVLDRIYAFADKVRSGEWTGVTGKKIETVVNIGIGGSDLGPVMVYEALKPYADAGISARYISNIDPNDLAEKTKGLDPETTLFIIVSKTFTTLETLTNAREARTWLLEELKAKGAIDGSDEKNAEAIKKHFVAVSTNLEKVAEFGIDPANAFGFWNWVGGRYSVDAAVGTSLAVVFGPERFEEFLHGFHEIDEYFANTPFEKNVVVLLGMLNVWYRNFFKVASHAVLPYDQYLHRFPAYLQQLTMESNGKSVRWDGTPVTSETGEIFWGEPGTNGGERGDLLVEAVVSKHPVFVRKDMNIYSTVPISFAKAALGGPIIIKTVDGQVEYEVKAGTQTDTKVRLKGKGVPSLRNKAVRGDHYVTLVVQVPERMNEEQRQALRRFDELMTGKITKEDEGHKKKGFFSK